MRNVTVTGSSSLPCEQRSTLTSSLSFMDHVAYNQFGRKQVRILRWKEDCIYNVHLNWTKVVPDGAHDYLTRDNLIALEVEMTTVREWHEKEGPNFRRTNFQERIGTQYGLVLLTCSAETRHGNGASLNTLPKGGGTTMLDF